MSDVPVFVRKATTRDHKALCQLARKSAFTTSFTSNRYSAEDRYEKGWIRVLVRRSDSKKLGFTCVRHKVRGEAPATSLYFLGVAPEERGKGYGKLLLEDAENESPHDRLEVVVEKDNETGLKFLKENGFQKSREAPNGRLYMAKAV